MTTTVYDRIGKGYTTHRRADARIVDFLVDLLSLPEAGVIADIGAGTGNYSVALAERGYRVKAVEPSSTMRVQAGMHPRVEWIDGTAESIPLPDDSAGAVVNILAFHHFASQERAFVEMARICKSGPIVLFTCDPRLVERQWLSDYFPSVWGLSLRAFPPLAEVEKAMAAGTRREVTTHVFEIPHDLQDLFVAAVWRRPELFFDPQVRACTSVFALADQDEINADVERLKEDLKTGEWNRKYGWLLPLDRFDAGFRFVCAKFPSA